ncbi:dTDP-4-dehydrorhamnose 3,5-epimerase [Clostridioides difficile]|uniref:dTDP-4-dehydrorhamnose 3,5-epimerase n=1 Tax=Clostridioides difficile TaxID=1496 RepID=UPI0002F1B941|nr:dTDP-4-dehydrorhamnose 3,5-epimerase [Clostridioides difficile]AXU48552.1 dtdp-4-dehydrorhamnose 3,5-epimerase [Clostridioides difficile]AXU73974.1 dtdp-4-dehydrorhamnose 3,5-epimerase [Clostridioides difficile]EGT2197525.1 dTDP-4-dehydrorhamnose 3,5-epimerase [Clostridioides difficile]EGT4047178.1 dTDP-4-dehydrorhamnose 3,5-epimerase [Clostridioides difficile]EGT4222922.1 dTDP-4-dehydrorhamnose 3,5-epimerase [Clostridioides difficile]
MGKFNFINTKIDGLYIIEPNVFCDERGYFMESYNKKDFKEHGLDMCFVQDNESSSRKGVLRGMHFQTKYPQGKLVKVTEGEVFDVAVDLRKDSQTFGKWEGVTLSDKNKKQFYIPEGFAHGFLVLSEKAVFSYKCTNYYHPEFESGFMWNDKQISIEWPLEGIEEILLSAKDKKQKSFKDICIES